MARGCETGHAPVTRASFSIKIDNSIFRAEDDHRWPAVHELIFDDGNSVIFAVAATMPRSYNSSRFYQRERERERERESPWINQLYQSNRPRIVINNPVDLFPLGGSRNATDSTLASPLLGSRLLRYGIPIAITIVSFTETSRVMH